MELRREQIACIQPFTGDFLAACTAEVDLISEGQHLKVGRCHNYDPTSFDALFKGVDNSIKTILDKSHICIEGNDSSKSSPRT